MDNIKKNCENNSIKIFALFGIILALTICYFLRPDRGQFKKIASDSKIIEVYNNSSQLEQNTGASVENNLSEVEKTIKISTFSILSFGDLMLGRYVRDLMDKGLDPFAKIEGTDGNFLKGTDFLMANLEGPITAANDCVQKAYSFEFNPEVAPMLAEKGFNIFSLANNHSLDCKAAGFEDTKKYLSQSGIDYFGDPAQEGYIIKEISGQKIAFLGLNLASGQQSLEKYLEVTKRLDGLADEVIVSVHWGVEYEKMASGLQISAAHKLIDNGADVIFGHHPHVVQNFEVYNNKPIFYSLGNFVFDQTGVEENTGLGVGLVARDEIFDFYLYPLNIVRSQPVLMPAEKANEYCRNYLRDTTGQTKSTSDCQFEIVAN